MEFNRASYYKGHTNWTFNNNNETRQRSSLYHNDHQNNGYYNYNQHNHHQQPQQQKASYQNKYPEEWRNKNLQEIKAKKMIRARKDRSAVNPVVKHFLFIVNVLFLVAGVAITSMSIYVLVESEEEENNINCFLDFIFSPACLLCLLGGLVVVPAFLGCYGALRENTCVIKSHFLLAILLLVIEIVLVIFFFIFVLVPDALSNIGVYPVDFLEESILRYGDRVHKDGSCGRDGDDYVDLIQDKFSCCGWSDDDEGYLDWNRNPYYNCSSSGPEACSVPISCCRADTTTYDCGADMLNPVHTDFSPIYTQGCEKGMREVFEDNIVLIACAAGGGIVIQILFTYCSMKLNSQVKEQRSKWR